MLFWSIKITIISIILIFLVHNLIYFFKSTLTIPKIKDLVNTSSKKYENMYNTINQQPLETNSNFDSTTNLDLLPINNMKNINTNTLEKEEESNINLDMKNELKDFFKNQFNNVKTTSNTIENTYSIYEK